MSQQQAELSCFSSTFRNSSPTGYVLTVVPLLCCRQSAQGQHRRQRAAGGRPEEGGEGEEGPQRAAGRHLIDGSVRYSPPRDLNSFCSYVHVHTATFKGRSAMRKTQARLGQLRIYEKGRCERELTNQPTKDVFLLPHQYYSPFHSSEFSVTKTVIQCSLPNCVLTTDWYACTLSHAPRPLPPPPLTSTEHVAAFAKTWDNILSTKNPSIKRPSSCRGTRQYCQRVSVPNACPPIIPFHQ